MTVRAEQLRAIIDFALAGLRAGTAAAFVIDDLRARFGGRCRFSCGAYELSLAGIRASCTIGYAAVLSRWIEKAEAEIAAVTA